MISLNARETAALAALGSALLLAGAFGFQLAGYAPCPMCIWQRWPHAVAAVIGLAIWFAGPRRVLIVAGLCAALIATGLAFYHAGIELGLWQGATACTAGVADLASMSTADLMAQLQGAPVVRCDEPAWSLFGISMAGWNGLISSVLVVLWAAALRRGA
ncbi:MAG: disulfide bond formation protein B [Paracoccus sp. (in: a-proteobacteria)]|nr:disulfide bond formation protein B [Paracoccus sp. (in: a-proteobacteria)]